MNLMIEAERNILADARLHVAKDEHLRLFRNNTGAFYDDKSNRMIRYGLCTGSSDLIGWRTIIVTPEMVGRKLAVFIGAECKAKYAYPTPDQRVFISQLKAMGGYAGIFRSGEQLRQLTLGLEP